MHTLSSKLAIYAVKHIGGAILETWKSGEKSADKAIGLLDICLRHPAVTNWQDGIVKSWAKSNPDKVCNACSPSLIIERLLHSIEHIEKGIKATDQFVNHSGIIDQLATHYNSNSTNEIDVEGLKNNINTALKNCTSLTARAIKIKAKWDIKYPRPDNCGEVKNSASGLHLIQEGEFLSTIATKYNTSVLVLKKLNNLTSDNILAGEYLKVPQK